MNIAIRSDASSEIGTGHVMRCLTLAEQLSQNHASVTFLSDEDTGNLNRLIESRGYNVHRLHLDKSALSGKQGHYRTDSFHADFWKTDIEQCASIFAKIKNLDWLIVDQYGLDLQWERLARTFCSRILVIDDLANRRHDCDVLLDQNIYDDMHTRYDDLLPDQCKRLLGPSYALLRSEFAAARSALIKRNGSIKRIFIFFGGSDLTNETQKALNAFLQLNRSDITADVVVGSSNPHKESIRSLCSLTPNVQFHYQIDNMAQLMARSDIALGAGGSTTWERCCLGLPSLVVTVAENQVRIAQTTHQRGVITYLGHHDVISATDIFRSIQDAIDAPEKIAAMSDLASRVVDGKGVERVAQALQLP